MLLGLVGLGAAGIEVPFIRQVVGFVYLTFIPGIVILRLLRIHGQSTIVTLLYAVGLSIAFLMFLGLLINFALPLVGISEPLSCLPLVITTSVIVLALCALSYWRDRDFSAPAPVEDTGDNKGDWVTQL